MRRAHLLILVILVAVLAGGCGRRARKAAGALRAQRSVSVVDRGGEHLESGDYDKAIAEYTKALRKDPGSADALHGRGEAYCSNGEFDKGLADYREWIRVHPEDPEAHNALAWVLATCAEDKVRNGIEALKHGRKAVALRPNDARYEDTLAAAFAEVGQFADALRWQKKALARADFPEEFKESARQRLTLYEQKQPYRDVGNKGY